MNDKSSNKKTDSNRKVLVVEDDSGLRSQMRWALSDFDVHVAEDRPSALSILKNENPIVVVLDLGLPPDPNGTSEGFATLEEILAAKPTTKVIIATGNEERKNALKAIASGAYDFYPKPVDIDVLSLVLNRAIHLYGLEEENRRLSREKKESALSGVISASTGMSKVCQMVEKVGPTEVSVLLAGESGTGKEILACSLHDLSARAARPFVAINCAAIPENLLESELFGHEKGAFTGAIRQAIGKIERADGGTLFLDEVGDMPLPLQAKLLRFLQSRIIERVGGQAQIEVNVRIISATNQILEEMIEQGLFREDLYYRLNEVEISIPPLRDREGDSILLAKYFLEKYNEEQGRKAKSFSSDALAALASHGWPGNVRELENKMKRAVVLCEGNRITASDLDLASPDTEVVFPSLKQVRDKTELEAVTKALEISNHKISAAARLLDISRPTLYQLMNQFGLRK